MSAPRRLADELRIRVNPEYDHAVEPEDNPIQYWNPVSATNDLIKLANAALDVAQNISDAMRSKVTNMATKRDLEAELDALERELLVKEPPTTAEAKSLKLTQAAIERRAKEHGSLERLQELRKKLLELDRTIEKQQTAIDVGYMWLKANERMSDNIKSALAFYKDERRRSELGV
jgi:Mg2+ and Co2+ transporter CorA